MITAVAETLAPKSLASCGSIGSTTRRATPELALASARRKMVSFRMTGRLLDRRPRIAHHLAPLVVVGLEVGGELRGRVRVGLHAGRGDEFLHLLGAHQPADFAVQLRDDVARRSRRRERAGPADSLVA